MFIGYFRIACPCSSDDEISLAAKEYQVFKLNAHMNRHTFIHVHTDIHILIYNTKYTKLCCRCSSLSVLWYIHTYMLCVHCIVIHLSQEEIAKLVDSGRYNTTDDFTVVVQPFMIGMHLPLLVNEQDPN